MKRLAVALLMSTAAARVVAQTAPASVKVPLRTITVLPSDPEAAFTGGLIGSPGGKLIYYATNVDVRVYDRATKKTAKVLKGSYDQIATSWSGDRLAMIRGVEGKTPVPGQPSYVWTVAVNSVTGAATGEPRRVSLLPGDSPAFSPDGKWIAFVTTPSPGKLVVTPSTGGVERVVVDGGAISGSVQWSADAKSIYFAESGVPKGPPVLARVAAAGGTPEPVVPPGAQVALPAPDGEHLIGVTAGSESGVTVGIFDADRNPLGTAAVTFDTANGVPCAIGWSGNGLNMLGALFATKSSLHARTLSGGTDRTVPISNNAFGDVFISPDGKRIAARVMTDSGWGLAIMNADGSDRRTVQPFASVDPGQDLVWSPDATYVVYRTGGRHTLYVAEAATRKATKVGSAEFRLGEARWRADSRTLLYVRMDGTATQSKLSIRQTSPSGQDRLVRDLTPELPAEGESWYATSWFLADSTVLDIRLGLVMPINGGAIEKLYEPIKVNNEAMAPAVSYDGRWVAVPSADGRAFQLIDRDSKIRRTLTVPASGSRDNNDALFDAGGHALIVGIAGTLQMPAAIYSLPLDGGAPRPVVTLAAGQSFDGFWVSPDGKTLLYARQGPLTVTLVEADLGAALTKKPPARH